MTTHPDTTTTAHAALLAHTAICALCAFVLLPLALRHHLNTAAATASALAMTSAGYLLARHLPGDGHAAPAGLAAAALEILAAIGYTTWTLHQRRRPAKRPGPPPGRCHATTTRRRTTRRQR